MSNQLSGKKVAFLATNEFEQVELTQSGSVSRSYRR